MCKNQEARRGGIPSLINPPVWMQAIMVEVVVAKVVVVTTAPVLTAAKVVDKLAASVLTALVKVLVLLRLEEMEVA